MTRAPSPLAADALPPVEKPPVGLLIATALGALIGNLIATAAVLYISLIWLIGLDLSFAQFGGAVILASFLRPS